MIRNRLKRISIDFSYNIISSIISTATIQIILYPSLAKLLGDEKYGALLTFMGIINTISSSLLGSLNNVRLIRNEEYEKKGVKGDFNPLLIITLLISMVFCYIVFIYTYKTEVTLAIALVLVLGLHGFREYYFVGYRLKLNFRLNLIAKIFSSAGYIIGLLIAKTTAFWPFAFIAGELFSCIFIAFTTDVINEPIKFTPLCHSTVRKFVILICSGFVGNVFIYFDRLFIYPVLGAAAVSAYSVASYFGKSLAIILTPIASVLLSYYSRKDYNMTRKLFWITNVVTIGIAVLFIGFSYFAAPYVIKYLYPGIFESAKPYLFIGNTAATIGVVANMAQPAVLKYAPTFWQIIVLFVYGGVYLVSSIILVRMLGLYGFALSVAISNLTRTLILYLVGDKYVKTL
ncbi:hypothetical protein E9840_08575 [Tissierella creatinini]|nr:hypothetical protein E9840_08575 [Tissierella creatinini]TJX61061.1 hypothetical protein E8P77_18915 [Soehngenia saccharolytica]